MRFFDLHCDTLFRAVDENKNLSENDFHVSKEKIKSFDKYIGCFAAWISDDYRGEDATEMFDKMSKKLIESLDCSFKKCGSKEILENTECGALFTVENGAALGGSLENIRRFYDLGVRAMTLTWNGSNEIGDGIGVEKPRGITKFGRRAVQEMEETGIAIDLSHASEELFYDVSCISRKPFIATHSNAREVCSHKRNLTDEQIKAIRSVHGIIGINFCDYFLKNDGNAGIDDIIRHIEYFLSAGCEDCLCIGSDFDGTDMPGGVSGIESVEDIFECCRKNGYREELLDKIFFENAYNFWRKAL